MHRRYGQNQQSASGSSFRRLADPIMVPCGLTPSQVPINSEWLAEHSVTSFALTNPNPFYVRLKGSYNDPGFVEVAPETGWLFPPGLHAIYGTQYPDFVSAMAVEKPGFPIKDANGEFLFPGAVVELAYGTGA